jgi:hypothetical protein
MLRLPWHTARRARSRPLILTNPDHVDAAARALARGGVIGYGFANFYVISTRPNAATVRGVNLMKGRPAEQVGSVMTTRERIPALFDWSRLPVELSQAEVLRLMDALFELGPFGFRGPAAPHMPAHLTHPDGEIITTQVIAPGYACPSNRFLARSLELTGETYLYGTSANRSRHLTGAEDEPAHYTAEGLEGEFAHEPGFVMLRHADEAAARRAYPLHAPMSTTILAIHRVAGIRADGRPRLIVERHGSLEVGALAPIVERLGFALKLGPKAVHRLSQREYAAQRRLGGAA